MPRHRSSKKSGGSRARGNSHGRGRSGSVASGGGRSGGGRSRSGGRRSSYGTHGSRGTRGSRSSGARKHHGGRGKVSSTKQRSTSAPKMSRGKLLHKMSQEELGEYAKTTLHTVAKTGSGTKLLNAYRELVLLTKFAEGSTQFKRFGGPETLSASMAERRHNAPLMTLGCQIVAQVCDSSNESKMRFSACEMVDLLVYALEKSPGQSHHDMQVWVMHALWHLSSLPINQEHIAEIGGVERVCASLEANWEGMANTTLQEHGLGILSRLSGNTEVAAYQVELGAMDLIIAAINNGAHNPRVVENGMKALVNMMFIDNHKLVLAELGGIDLAVAVMSEYGGNQLIVTLCTVMLTNFSRKQVFHQALFEFDAPGAISWAKQQYGSDEKIVEQARIFMANMGINMMGGGFGGGSSGGYGGSGTKFTSGFVSGGGGGGFRI